MDILKGNQHSPFQIKDSEASTLESVNCIQQTLNAVAKVSSYDANKYYFLIKLSFQLICGVLQHYEYQHIIFRFRHKNLITPGSMNMKSQNETAATKKTGKRWGKEDIVLIIFFYI